MLCFTSNDEQKMMTVKLAIMNFQMINNNF